MKTTKNPIGTFQDARDRMLVGRSGHAHTKPYVVYHRITVLGFCRVPLPVDSEVIGIDSRLGELYLKLRVVPCKLDLYVDHYFIAFNDDGYMKYPNLGFIDRVKVGDSVWSVFTDDMFSYHKGAF